MIKLTDLIKKPIRKEDILSVLTNTENKITKVVIPTYKNAVSALKGSELKDTAKGLYNSLILSYDNGNKDIGKTISNIHKDMSRIRSVISELESSIDDILPVAVVSDNLTLRAETLMKLTSQIEFAASYSVVLLDYLISNVDVYDQDDGGIPPAMSKYILANVTNFGLILNFLTANAKKIILGLDNIPDVYIYRLETSTLAAGISRLKSMLSLSTMERGFRNNPIYHIRLWFVEIQVRKYQGDKDRKQLLELKISKLKDSKDGKNNAKVDKSIEYYQKLVNELDYAIHKYETEVNL